MKKMSLSAAHCKLIAMIPEGYHTSIKLMTDRYSRGNIENRYSIYINHPEWEGCILIYESSFEECFKELDHYLSQHGLVDPATV